MFDLELARVVQQVKEKEAKKVVVQLPAGLKQQAQAVVDLLEKETGAEVYIWLSSCFGACDIPLGLEALRIDLLVQWGHNRYNKTPEGW